jgi:hypothetical protein
VAQMFGSDGVLELGDGLVPCPHPGVIGHDRALAGHPHPVQVGMDLDPAPDQVESNPSGLDRADWAADAGDGPVTRRIEPSARLVDPDMTFFKRTPWIGHPQSIVDKSQ